MKSQQGRALQAFRRVQAWFAQHPEVLANSGSSKDALGKQLDALTQVVDSMTAGATEQTTQKGQATLAAKDESTLRADIRSLHLKSIVNLAEGLRGKIPGMGVFKLPSSGTRSENLLHAAQAIRTTAGVYKDVFVEHGLPADFLDQLDAAIAALEQSVDARGIARSRISAASATLASERSLGRQIVTMIDASLAHVLKSDSATLASWRQAKRVTLKGARSRDVLPVAPAPQTEARVAQGGSPIVQVASPIAPAATPSTGIATPLGASEVPASTTTDAKAA
jgi:hypothetical protein